MLWCTHGLPRLLVNNAWFVASANNYSSFNHQVEDAFTQGLGLFTMEQCVYLEGNGRTQRGQLFTTGPGTYKIPAVSDIPVQLNITLLDGTSNPQAIFSSKVAPQCQHSFTSLAKR